MATRSSYSSLLDRREFVGTGALALAGAVSAASAKQQDPLEAAADTLGAISTKTLQFTASGAGFTVGQNFTPNDPWPRVAIKRYAASINYETGSMRLDLVREMGATMPRGGGVPFTGELHQIQAVSGEHAWNIPVSAPPPGGGAGPAWAGPGGSPQPVPAPESRIAGMLALWSTPHGFVRAAMANNATTRKVKGGTNVWFAIGGKYKMDGFINARNQVERVRTWIDQSIVGDMLIETEYGDYKNFGGVLFPKHIRQRQDGFPSLDLTVSSVNANQSVDIIVPDNVRDAPPAPPVNVKAQKIADGVFWLLGGTHHSLAIGMKDHIVLVDTPNGEARALAVMAKAKELIPGQPIRYVIAMHHHWDHLGGIRTAIDEGATIITHRTNRAFLMRAARAPHAINPDRLSVSKRALKLQTVEAEGTLSDGTRTVKLYTMTRFEHCADMLLVYLPKEKVLAEADAYTPPQTAATPLDAPKVPYAAALYDNIRRLNLDVQTIVPFHGMRTVDLSEVARQSGRVAAAVH
jgi:glyoxylase-like metal-dependent hydrolase (beta-lactamase superfamily II)